MNAFNDELTNRLRALRDQNLCRELRRIDSPQSRVIRTAGRELLNFSSNDYLGLANDPLLKEAAVRAVERHGCGAGASRLICGSLSPFHELEEALAAFKNAPAALSFSTGYTAALGTITALLGKDDIIILDKLVHASIVDAARLSNARLRVFAHNDLNDLEEKLRWAAAQSSGKPDCHTLVVTESIFSMDGDRAPLDKIVELKEKHGAWLMVDEAHATGICGRQGRGVADEHGVASRIEIQMGTLGKALGASGGYICGSRTLIDYLVNRARSFIFSTAPMPAAAAAARVAVEFIQSESGEQRRQSLRANLAELQAGLQLSSPPASAIVPVIVGDEAAAVAIASRLREQGIFVPAIRYPTVARGSARLRITVTATHKSSDIQRLTRELENRKS